MSKADYIPKNYSAMFECGILDLSDLISEGLHQTSRKYRNVGKTWKAYGRTYTTSVTLTEEQFKEFAELKFLDSKRAASRKRKRRTRKLNRDTDSEWYEWWDS